MRLDIVALFQKTEIQSWEKVHVASSATVISDGLRAFGGVTAQECHTPSTCHWQRKKAAMPPVTSQNSNFALIDDSISLQWCRNYVTI